MRLSLPHCGRLSFLSSSSFSQSFSFAAPWSLRAEDMARSLIAEWDDIGDEQYSLADRSADRAERFAGYRDKRATEAVGRAETVGVVGVASDRVAGIEQRRIDRAATT